jgi:hypothetical protein
VSPDVRNAVITVGLIFWAFFALMTVTVIIEQGIDILTISAIVILALLAPPLFSSLFRGHE